MKKATYTTFRGLSIETVLYGGFDQDFVDRLQQGRDHPGWTKADIGRPYFFEKFTPEMANFLISRSRNSESYENRKLSTEKVKQYEAMILRGKFLSTNDVFTFDWLGSGGNGQHRLHAIRNTGVTMEGITIKIGLDPEALLVMDTAQPRTEGEWYKAKGYKDFNKLAKLVNLYRNWWGLRNPDDWKDTRGKRYMLNSTNEQMSRQLNNEFFDSLTDQERGFAVHAIDVTRTIKSNLLVDWSGPATLVFSVFMAGGDVAKTAIAEFMRELSLPDWTAMPDSHPVAQVVKRIQKLHGQARLDTSFKFMPAHRTELLLRAWNCYGTNQNISRRAMGAPFEMTEPFIYINKVVRFTKKRRKS